MASRISNANISTPVPFSQSEYTRDSDASSPTTDMPNTRLYQCLSRFQQNTDGEYQVNGGFPSSRHVGSHWATRIGSTVIVRNTQGFVRLGWSEEQQRRRAGSRTSQGEDRTSIAASDKTTCSYRSFTTFDLKLMFHARCLFCQLYIAVRYFSTDSHHIR